MLLYLTLSFFFLLLLLLLYTPHPSAMKSHFHIFYFLNQIRATLTTLASAIFPNKKPILQPPPQSTPLPPSILHLPDLVLECILQELPPDALFRMAATCTALREMCAADHLWETHLSRKWGKIIKPSSRQDWALIREEASRKRPSLDRGFVDYVTRLWPIELIRSGFACSGSSANTNFPPPDSVMSWYLALESGNFWFPAQVFNRENGHVGFMLSCYDAELCYDRRTNTFQARYPPHGRRISAIEFFVTWDRLRAPPVDTSPHDLYVSDCLNDLQPGDQIEIQWRRNKEFPYGWWYGIVGHLDTCDRNTHYCRCSDNDTVVLEFNQFTRGSRWRTTTVNRKDHREEGNEVDGFYGGIRKLLADVEISAWEKLWPSQSLE